MPVGISAATSAVSDKSFVSCSKTRGVNEISPNVVWSFVVGIVSPDGEMMGSPLEALLRSTKGMFVVRSRRRLSGVKRV